MIISAFYQKVNQLFVDTNREFLFFTLPLAENQGRSVNRMFVGQGSRELCKRTARQKPSPLGKVDFAKQKTDEVVKNR